MSKNRSPVTGAGSARSPRFEIRVPLASRSGSSRLNRMTPVLDRLGVKAGRRARAQDLHQPPPGLPFVRGEVLHLERDELPVPELCLTPANASWANPVEAHFGPLRTFVMGNSD